MPSVSLLFAGMRECRLSPLNGLRKEPRVVLLAVCLESSCLSLVVRREPLFAGRVQRVLTPFAGRPQGVLVAFPDAELGAKSSALLAGHLCVGSEVSLIEQRLDSGEVSPFPLLRCRNVFVLPGIPALLQKKWQVGGERGCCASGTCAGGSAAVVEVHMQGHYCWKCVGMVAVAAQPCGLRALCGRCAGAGQCEWEPGIGWSPVPGGPLSASFCVSTSCACQPRQVSFITH
jgi:hypothetical protein